MGARARFDAMKLLLKFNLVFLVVFVVGLALAIVVARSLLQQAATDEAASGARLLMASATAVSSYTARQVSPLLETQMKYSFLPQSVPSYASAESVAALRKNFPEYDYKAAMLNPTNPRDRAADWEEDIVKRFRASPELKETIGQRDTPTGQTLYIAKPLRITDAACLLCHSTPEAAPATLVARYGSSNGFNWTLNEVLGAQVVTVPMDVPLQRADQALKVVVGALVGLFVLIGGTLNLMLWKLVIHPVSTLSALADRVSMGEPDVPPFEVRSKDEIGVLTASLGRMQRGLVQAMKMLEG
jgi:protein-histidine pros-kinase